MIADTRPFRSSDEDVAVMRLQLVCVCVYVCVSRLRKILAATSCYIILIKVRRHIIS